MACAGRRKQRDQEAGNSKSAYQAPNSSAQVEWSFGFPRSWKLVLCAACALRRRPRFGLAWLSLPFGFKLQELQQEQWQQQWPRWRGGAAVEEGAKARWCRWYHGHSRHPRRALGWLGPHRTYFPVTVYFVSGCCCPGSGLCSDDTKYDLQVFMNYFFYSCRCLSFFWVQFFQLVSTVFFSWMDFFS